MRNLRFVAELTDGDPPLLRARCSELDVAISIDSGAYVRVDYALGVIAADAIAERIPRGEDRRVVVDVVRGTDPDGNALAPQRLLDFELRAFLETLDGDGGGVGRRSWAMEETIPA